MASGADPYAVLGVARSADDKAIRAAYAARISALTPAGGGALTPLADLELQLLNAAFALLSDARNRARLDAGQGFTSPPPAEIPAAPPSPPPPSPPPFQPPLISEASPGRSPRAPSLGGGIPALAWIGGALAIVAIGLALVVRPQSTPSGANTAGSPGTQDAASASTPAGDPVALRTLVDWKADANNDPHVYSAAGLTISLSTHRDSASEHPQPVITVSRAGEPPFSVLGAEGFDTAAARFGVGKIDAKGGDDQVLFLTYTGGAHCCTNVILIEHSPSGWREKNLGTWDGEPLAAFPTDIDGDGVPDLVFNDQRFAYAFTFYADSYMPPRIFNVVGGRTSEVSSDPKFRPLFQGESDKARASCLTHNNGACAAYLAIASRLGTRDEAWRTMEQSYDRASNWVLLQGCRIPTQERACPASSQIAFKDFPAALAWFLVDEGYPSWSPPMEAANPLRPPSFNCARVRSVNLSLVCATPELSEADRILATLYQRALSTATDAGALQAEERAWIARRNSAVPDIDGLQQLYSERIGALRQRLGG